VFHHGCLAVPFLRHGLGSAPFFVRKKPLELQSKLTEPGNLNSGLNPQCGQNEGSW